MKCDLCGKEFKIGDRVIALADYLYGVLTEADGLTNITLGTRWCQACEDGEGVVSVPKLPLQRLLEYVSVDGQYCHEASTVCEDIQKLKKALL